MTSDNEQSNDFSLITTECGHEYLACATVVEHQRTPCPPPLPCPICSPECDYGRDHAMHRVRDDGRVLSGVTSPLAPEGIPDRETATFQEVLSTWRVARGRRQPGSSFPGRWW